LPLSNLSNLVVILVRPRNPLNIGAAARAMTNFGARFLRVVNPYRLAFREARSAVGAADILKDAEEFKSVAEAIGDCVLVVGTTAVRDRTLTQPLKRLNEQSAAVIRTSFSKGRVALLFGSEKTGLSNDDFSHCQWLMNIPTHETNISMNLGQAVAVCLYELARSDKVEQPAVEVEPATAEKVEQITEILLDALNLSGYIKPGTGKMFEKKARQLIRRMELEAYDAKLLIGMVRQILWKLRQSSRS
jgi:TrmH family RNA methyltransferase